MQQTILLQFLVKSKCVRKLSLQKNTLEILTTFYDEMENSRNEIKVDQRIGQPIYPKSKSSLPREIIEDINSNPICYISTFTDSKIKIHFIDNQPINRTLDVDKMLTWITILLRYATNKKCQNQLIIYIYTLVSLDRLLPTQHAERLGQIHVNGGFTLACSPKEGNELVVFRNQEWFKVFIHESLHAYGIDFATTEYSSVTECFAALFPVAKSDYLLSEAYTEFWAEIINIMMKSYSLSETKKSYLDLCQVLLNFERTFALFQMQKILQYSHLTYEELFYPNSFSEDTNILAYYIIRTILLNSYESFFKFLKDHRVIMFQSRYDEFFVMDLCRFIRVQSNNEMLLEDLARIKRVSTKNSFILKTLRMTITG